MYCKSQILLNSICPVEGAKMTTGVKITREQKRYTLDTTHDTILDIYTLDTTQSQITTHGSISGIWISRFHGQIPYNYKFL